MGKKSARNLPRHKERKYEVARRERDERLAARRTKDGGYKPIAPKGRGWRIALPIIIAVLVVAAILWILSGLGVFRSAFPVLRIGTRNIYAAEYNYYWNNMRYYYDQQASYGMLPQDANGRLDLNSGIGLEGSESSTWGDFLDKAAAESIRDIYIQADAAREENITLTDERRAEIDDFFNELNTRYGGQFGADNYLEQAYGTGIASSVLRPILERSALATQYAEVKTTSFEFTDDEVQEYYDSHQDSYDEVTWHQRLFKPAAVDSPTPTVSPSPAVTGGATPTPTPTLSAAEREKQIAENLDKAKKEAEDFLEAINSPEEFTKENSRLDEEAKGSDDTNDTEDNSVTEPIDTSLMPEQRLSSIYQKEISGWLFDTERKPGDKTVVESGGNVYALYFVGRKRAETVLPRVGYVIWGVTEPNIPTPEPTPGVTLSVKEQEEQQAKLDEQYETALQMEKERLGILADEVVKKATDELTFRGAMEEALGNGATNGGVLEKTLPSYFPTEGRKWIFSPERKIGDTTVLVEGSTVAMYYYIDPGTQQQWHFEITEQLREEAYSKFMGDARASASYKITEGGFGARYIDRK
ncbi:MAG: hypothetical protein GX900_06730 [Clostridiaceae bacterium]|nr:hypothetical protein [Clostridiaceae bacterium]